jgi:acyl-CoA synthetase (AMP-forming)/AMP-acid ligase II
MLIPIADVPRWYAERKLKDAVAVSHGADTLTWEQLERGANRRARAFAAKGVKPGDFVAIGLPTAIFSSRPPLLYGSAARRRLRCPGGCRAAKPPRCSISLNPRW